MSKQKKLIIGIASLVCLLFLVYIAGIFYYKDRLLPNTFINDVNYGNKSLFEIKNNLESQNEEYVLTLIKNDGTTEEIFGSDFSYRYEISDKLEEVKNNQNNVLWILSLFGESKYTLKTTVTYDETQLVNEIKKLNCLNNLAIKEPVNAYVEMTEDGIKVVEEQNGNKLKEEETINAIKEAVAKNKTQLNLSDSGCYMTAEITKDDPSIQAVINKVDNATNFSITYNFGEDSEVIDSEKISSWLIFDEQNNVSYNEAKMKQYVKNLAAKYDTYGKTRKFTTTEGEEITISNGILGWQMDVDATLEQLKELISNGETASVDAKYELYCLTRENDDIGNTYIEISIDKQHLWFYKNGNLDYESDIISGLPNGKRDTPKGAFCVWSREKGVTLGQYNDEGWEVPVDYWMPFDWSGCGLHDSNKKNFGGTTYKYNGSNGCVNCPEETAKYLYENIKTGTPVIIY